MVTDHEDPPGKFVDGEIARPVHMRIGIMGACDARCDFRDLRSPDEENFHDLFSAKDAIPTEKNVELMRKCSSPE